MRLWIVDRMATFPNFYNIRVKSENFSNYCQKMAIRSTPGSYLELQVASDIFFAVIEVYKESNLDEPYQVIMPLRHRTAFAPQCSKKL